MDCENWLTEFCSGAQSPAGGLPQGQTRFNAFINDWVIGHYTLIKFTENTKPVKVADRPDGCAAIKRDVGTLEKLDNKNLMKFNKGKCQVEH